LKLKPTILTRQKQMLYYERNVEQVIESERETTTVNLSLNINTYQKYKLFGRFAQPIG